MTHLHLMPVGANAILAETGDLDRALALLDQLQTNRPDGVSEIIPAAQTVLVKYNPQRISAKELSDHIHALDLTHTIAQSGQDIEIPVYYDGEDLDWLAQHLSISVADVIAKHQNAAFHVAFCGFAPGFAYMKCSDPSLYVPRRSSPRVRIPARSVALAGEFCGIYPSDSPGGWQLLGHTPLEMWDLSRAQPALLAPGDRVKFRDARLGLPQSILTSPKANPAPNTGAIVITKTDRPILMQDFGRPGLASQGVSAAGALDIEALRAANLALGNMPNEAALEINFGGVTLTVEQSLTFAAAGATCDLTITRVDGTQIPADSAAPIALDPGESLTLGPPNAGVYTYLALRGGYHIDPVLGSMSYDSLAKLGPRPLQSGDHIAPRHKRAGFVNTLTSRQLPSSQDEITLDVMEGPRADWFTAQGLENLYSQAWGVTLDSSRSGKRLHAPNPLIRKDNRELPSEGTVAGAIQVPHSGQPVLFLADHPLTGGYPVIAVIAPHHLDLASQIPPTAKIRFKPLGTYLKD